MRCALIICVCNQNRQCGSFACACGQESPPPVTLIGKSKTSSGKRGADNITIAAACAPAKKVAPSVSAPDLLPMPVFLDNPQATAAVKANLVEIVGSQMS